jgi:hypothetical protein
MNTYREQNGTVGAEDADGNYGKHQTEELSVSFWSRADLSLFDTTVLLRLFVLQS